MSTLYKKNFFKENRCCLYCLILFRLIGGVGLYFMEIGDMLLFFSNNRTRFGDLFFSYFTKMGEAPAYVLALLVLIFFAYRYVIFLPLIGLVVTYVAFITKAYFKHPRPFLYYRELDLFDQINVLENIELHGGANSFPSGHTMSAFALYAFVAFCLPYKKYAGVLLFLFALLVGLSRVYLVQHFFKDVYLGAIMGVLIAMILHRAQGYLSNHPDKWWNKAVRLKSKS